MIEPPFITNYSFTKNKNCFGCTEKRINLETADGKKYSIRAANKVGLPLFIKSLFWTQVTLLDNSKVYINKNSLVKRMHLSSSYVKSSLRTKRKDFDNLIRFLSKVDDMRKVLEKDEAFYYPKHVSIQIVEKIENNKDKYIAKATKEGSFVKEWKNGRTLIVTANPDTGHIDFYFSLHKTLGSGGFKTVYALVDYQTAKADLALSVQKMNMNSPKDINMPKKGLEFTSQLENSKRVIKTKFFIEKGVSRDEFGELKTAEDDAKAYIVTKRYAGTFNDIAKSEKITFNEKLTLFTYVLEGVVDMHNEEILHRDLKFENILYKKTAKGYKIKHNDFDLSCYFNDERALRCRDGTLSHMSPEVLGKQKITDPEKADAWSLGIMLYNLCEGDPKFIHGLGRTSKKEDKQKQVDQVLEGVQNLTFNKLGLNHALVPIIQGLLDPNPASRIKASQALDAIQNFLAPS